MSAPGPTPALIALWRAVLSGRAFAPARPLDEDEIAWSIEAGMGPLLYAAAQQAPGSVAEALMPRLKAADRWAQVQQADMFDATAQIVDRCADRAPPLTLLKGISICGEHYPSPHQRVLGDLDLLVEPEHATAVAAALSELGYRPPDSPTDFDYAAHHHLRPICHPRTRIVVELHTGLVPPGSGLVARGPFSADQLRAERRASEFEGRRVFRLSPELQVPYIATHWALGFVPTAGARSLLDMTLLLRGAGDRIDWARVLGWLADRRIAAHLQLMLSALVSWGLVELPPPLRAEWKRVAVLPSAVLRILIGMVDRYQIRGLMRRVPPLPVAEREAGPPTPGTLRSRLQTLRSAAASGDFSNLLDRFDQTAWERLLRQPPSAWRYALVTGCLLLPPGDPDRLALGRRIARLPSALRPGHRRDP